MAPCRRQWIRNDPDWNHGDYVRQPRHFVFSVPVFQFMVSSPVRLQQIAPTRRQADALYDTTVETARNTLDANDYLYWFESSWDYDPEPDLGKIKAKLFAVNFADDAINPAELGVLEQQVSKIAGARSVVVPASDKTQGHQTSTLAAIWKTYLGDLLNSLPETN